MRIMGVEIEGEKNVFSDNKSAVLNTSLLELMLKKRNIIV